VLRPGDVVRGAEGGRAQAVVTGGAILMFEPAAP
jgi:hypothetical protein